MCYNVCSTSEYTHIHTDPSTELWMLLLKWWSFSTEMFINRPTSIGHPMIQRHLRLVNYCHM